LALLKGFLLLFLFNFVLCQPAFVINLVVQLLKLSRIRLLAALAFFLELQISPDSPLLNLVLFDALLAAFRSSSTGNPCFMLALTRPVDGLMTLRLAVVRNSVAPELAFVSTVLPKSITIPRPSEILKTAIRGAFHSPRLCASTVWAQLVKVDRFLKKGCPFGMFLTPDRKAVV
jgi:hypothetical protein